MLRNSMPLKFLVKKRITNLHFNDYYTQITGTEISRSNKLYKIRQVNDELNAKFLSALMEKKFFLVAL